MSRLELAGGPSGTKLYLGRICFIAPWHETRCGSLKPCDAKLASEKGPEWRRCFGSRNPTRVPSASTGLYSLFFGMPLWQVSGGAMWLAIRVLLLLGEDTMAWGPGAGVRLDSTVSFNVKVSATPILAAERVAFQLQLIWVCLVEGTQIWSVLRGTARPSTVLGSSDSRTP